MKKDLQNALFKKYPKIFRQKDLPAQETAMCWGITVGDGWYDLIDLLCEKIQNRVENINSKRQSRIENSPKTLVPIPVEHLVCEATQVKEKFGMLCFYICGGDDFIRGLISMTESLSIKTCSKCGNRKEENLKRGWHYTLCSQCITQ